MENKTIEELQNELNRTRALFLNKSTNLANVSNNEKGLYFMELQNLQNKIDAIRAELDKRTPNFKKNNGYS
jgi:hypothetical protein